MHNKTSKTFVIFEEKKTQLKIISFQNYTHGCLILT